MEQNNEIKEELSSNQIIFNVTENIKKLGISQFSLQREFLIMWSNGRNSCIGFNFKSSSLSQNIKLIEKKLKKEARGNNIDDETFDNAIKDIEDQLIKQKDEIFNLNKTKASESDYAENEFKSEFVKDVSNLRTQFENSGEPYKEWEQEVKKKYENLKFIANTYFPDSWQLLQFCVSVKSVQNIYGNKTPFIGFILYKPSSLKSTIIDSFPKYPSALYVDDLTKNSFLSHYSTNSEEQLQNNDLIPKMKDKILLTSEIAPIINANEDDLRKILGIITRLIDGKGYQSHSGTHGHRSYPPMMFTWIGAGIEIPYKMWTMLSQLGFKLYFFRPSFKKKTIEDLKKIAKDVQLPEKKQKLEEALLDYLKVFDAAPQTGEIIVLDERTSGNPKIKWDQSKDEDSVVDCISNLANLLAALRGTVNTSFKKTRKSTKLNTNDNNNKNGGNDSETHDDTGFIQTEQIDYEIEPSVIEDASRAVIQLTNLALGNAISQGRNYLKKDDAKLIITVCFSTTKIYRANMLNLWLENNGELTTSQIATGLDISRPNALQTMQEFDALKIGKVSSISPYEKSERKIKLNDEYSWFLTEEFKQLYKPTTTLAPNVSRQVVCCNMNSHYTQIITKNLSNKYYRRACDTENNICHTSKANFNYERDKKNILVEPGDTTDKNEIKDLENLTKETMLSDNENENRLTDMDKINNYDEDVDSYKLKENVSSLSLNIQKNNSSLTDEKYFTHVTLSHENCHTENKELKPNQKQDILKEVIEDILKIIIEEHGQIALNYVLQLACQKSNTVKEFLKNEKLTARDSRKVRNIFVEIIRHPNIKVVKKKPQLVVKWIEQENEKEALVNN